MAVDREDPRRARERGALHHAEPHAARAEHRDTAPGPDSRGVDHRADAGDHRAAEQRSAVERQVGRDGEHPPLGHDSVVGEGGDAAEVLERAPLEREARRAVEETARLAHPHALGAERRAPGGAVLAHAARQAPEREHVVAGPHGGDAGADLGDDARALVAEDGGERRGHVPRHHVQVRVADAARGHADQHLARARRRELDVADLEPPPDLQEHRGAHAHGLPPYATPRKRRLTSSAASSSAGVPSYTIWPLLMT